MEDVLARLTDPDWWLDTVDALWTDVSDAQWWGDQVERVSAYVGLDGWLDAVLDEACGRVDCDSPYVSVGALLIALFVLRYLLGRAYIPLLRVKDVFDLVWGHVTTLGGLIKFVSPDEFLNRRKPATFMRLAERKRLLNQFNGGFLMDGKVQRLSRRMSYQSIVSVGGMGTGKTVNLITPNILTADECSLVITDTSGELYDTTSGYLASRGYDIKVLNLIDPARSHRYNPLARIETYADAEGLAHLLAKGTGSGHTQEPIWDDGAQRLLRIIILALKHGRDAGIATLEDVHYWVNSFDGHRKDSRFDELIVDGSVDDPSIMHDYRGFVLGTQEKMLLSFVSTAATSLSLVGNPDIASVLSGDDFDFRAMKHRKTALYIKVREQSMGTYGPILTMFYTELFDALREDMKGHYPVFLFLDEFGQIKAPGFPSFATTARKFRVGFWVILQSLSQLVDKYGQESATTIMNGIGTETYFGGMDLSTARDLSGRLGRTFRLDWWKIDQGPYERDLMRPEELIRLRDNDILMLYRNRDPVKLSTLPYFARRDLRRRATMQSAPLPYTIPDGAERETPLQRHTRRREEAEQAAGGRRTLFERVREQLKEREAEADQRNQKRRPEPDTDGDKETPAATSASTNQEIAEAGPWRRRSDDDDTEMAEFNDLG